MDMHKKVAFCDTCPLRVLCTPEHADDMERRVEQHFTNDPNAVQRAANVAEFGTTNPDADSRCPKLHALAQMGITVEDAPEWESEFVPYGPEWGSDVPPWDQTKCDECNHPLFRDTPITPTPAICAEVYNAGGSDHISDDAYDHWEWCDHMYDIASVLSYQAECGTGMAPCSVCGKPFDYRIITLKCIATDANGKVWRLPVCSAKCADANMDG